MKKTLLILNSYFLLSFIKLLIILLMSLVVKGFWEEQLNIDNFNFQSISSQMLIINISPYLITLLFLLFYKRKIMLNLKGFIAFSAIGFVIFYFFDFRQTFFFIQDYKSKIYFSTLLMGVLFYLNLKFLKKMNKTR
ncbi:hypothetical protein RQM59_02590 [Flavobacteriaceae bacterium S356]|uniref:Uncharacterized protein n=1 Tax=Asprobacillus argus TaxID=3076534 RepID=A0ABU3LC20_9FLAO|nr:hypothetical protein [Flavobacteriaceae bacterium S356]